MHLEILICQIKIYILLFSSTSQPSLQSTFNTYNASINPISCVWSVRPEERFLFDNCSIPRSFYWNVDPLGIPEVSEISQTVAMLMNHVKEMESMSLETYRYYISFSLSQYTFFIGKK